MSNDNSKPGSSRLTSLSRNATAKPKAGLKFKPKVVARRSEKERASDAPVIKEDVKKKLERRNVRGRGRGRGGRGGLRGGRGFVKTEIVSSGPLSSATFSAGGGGNNRVNSMSPTPEYFTSLKREVRSRSVTADSDDEDDPTKIDLNKDFEVAEDDDITSLFPVRPLQFSGLGVDTDEDSSEQLSIKTEVKDEFDSKLPSKPAQDERDLDEEDTELELLKDNMRILKLIDAHTIPDPNIKLGFDAEDKKTKAKPKSDFMLLQLPHILPTFKDTSEMEIDEKNQDQPKSGRIGSLKVHRSGKITIRIGDTPLDVIKSASVGFLQDVVLCEYPEPKDEKLKKGKSKEHDGYDEDAQEGRFLQIGQVGDKLLTIPRIFDNPQ